MTYRPLSIPPAVGPWVRSVVTETLDPRLADAHAMLRLPLPSAGIAPGCNFALADSLFGVIEGVSAVLYPRDKPPGPGFVACVQKFYPVTGEPAGAMPASTFAEYLWERFRNPMQHCLGLALDRPEQKTGVRPRVAWSSVLIVQRDFAGLAEYEIEQLEQPGQYPARLGRPTMQANGETLILSVEAFYVGTRRLVETFLTDELVVRDAEIWLSVKFPEVKSAGHVVPGTLSGATMSSTATTVTSYSLHGPIDR